MKRSTPVLDGLTRFLKDVGGRYELDVQPESQDTADKLKWLKAQGRDFLAMTPSLQAQLLRSLSAQASQLITSGGNLRAQQTLDAMGAATKSFVLLRFKNDGNDVAMRPLSPRYLAWKLAKGMPGLIGVAHQQLRNAVAGATFTWTKKG